MNEDKEKQLRSSISEEVSRQVHPDRSTRPPDQVQKLPDWYQRTQPTGGQRSDWSGGWARGQNWSGGRDR